MKEIYEVKHHFLITEFTNYLITHPRFNLPLGVEVILLDSGDKGYTRYMLKCAPKKNDNLVFIDVGELAPIRSRLKNPKIITREAARKINLKEKSVVGAKKIKQSDKPKKSRPPK